MSLSTFEGLKETVISWTLRTDSAFSSQFPTFVTLAEQRIFNGDPEMNAEPLAVEQMEVESTVTITEGVGDKPADATSIRSLTRPNDAFGLRLVAPYRAEQIVSTYRGMSNPMYYYTAATKINVLPGGWSGDLDIVYYARPTALTDQDPTNAVFAKYPDIWLHGCLVEAFDWMDDDDRLMKAVKRYTSALQAANSLTQSQQSSGTQKVIMPRVTV